MNVQAVERAGGPARVNLYPQGRRSTRVVLSRTEKPFSLAGILLGGQRAASTSVSPHEGSVSPSVTTPDPPNTITIKMPVTVDTVATVP